MDIYTVVVRVIAESLAVANETLNNLVDMPANASGPLDPSITMTDSGLQFIGSVAGAAVGAGQILCDMFQALFP
jgi:hypothetical protein